MFRYYLQSNIIQRVPKGLIMEKNATLDFTFGNSSTYMRGPFAIKKIYIVTVLVWVLYGYIYPTHCSPLYVCVKFKLFFLSTGGCLIFKVFVPLCFLWHNVSCIPMSPHYTQVEMQFVYIL